MDELSAIAARVNGSNAIAELLDAAFDAFEFIRRVARACEVRAPELFAAFMLAAGSAVEGRNALNDAPSLPRARNGLPLAPTVSPGADVGLIADELAAFAALVAHRLSEVAGQADLADDRNACEQAARAAVDVQRLLGQGTDATSTR
jgi:hypothetical protein